ncbi:MAG: PAS domain S-box protein [Methanospirillum sp.]|uniref:response regulator n=1 Tax=Methanospirillum sp. TaxID=45200 RepID=UPI00236EEDCD|nr:response regulator [Methanospirillum sp.]MDD1729517.1 PAS domain S-box protein [Methanospirillum sp.]
MTDTVSQSSQKQMISLLYVDDEQDLLFVGKRFLERSGEFRVDIMSSVQEALNSSQIQSYDVIISDFQMPGMDGISFLKVVREQFGDIPFILFTGRGREEVVIEAINNGVDFYLQKGGEPQAQFAELSQKIRQVVRRRQAELSLQESERRYRDVVETQTEFICRFTPDGTLLFTNEAYYRYFGKQREDVIGHKFIASIPEEDHHIVNHHFASLTVDHPVAEIEHRIILPDGTTRWQWWNDHAFFDDTGAIIEYQSVGRDITDSKLATEALRESEEKFRVLADAAPVAIIVYQDSRYVYINDHTSRATGYSKEELYALNFWELLHPDFQEKAKEKSLARLRGEPIPCRYDIRYITKTGEVRWADLTAGVIQYGGKPATIVMMVGISERKAAEEELRSAYEQLSASEEELQIQFDALQENQHQIRQSEQAYRSIIENLEGAFYRSDIQGNLIMINSSFVEKFGYSSAEEVIGKNIRDNFYVDPSDRDTFLAKIMKYGKVKEERIALKTHNGSPVMVSISSRIVYDDSKNPHYIEGIIRDITDTIRVEEALRESEEKFRSFVENANEIVYSLTPDGIFTYMSPNVTELLGYTQNEVIGKSATLFVHPDDYSHNRELFIQARITGKKMSGNEYRIPHKDGTWQWHSQSISPICDAKGKVIAIQGISHDITERKRSEEAIKKANHQLNLLSGITRHDILNKITAIRGYIAVAEMEYHDPGLSEYLQRMRSATDEIQSQIEFTRIYQDLGSHEPQWVQLETVMPASSLSPGITRISEIHGISIFADPMLEMVFFNLLDNSVRHGGRVTEIRVSAHESDGNLIVVWEDNGVGISGREKESIFEEGFGNNAGLGMFLVREILSLTGISIKETGKEGEGARFEIRVPKGGWQVS